MTHPVTLLSLFAVSTGIMTAANIWLFQPLTANSRYGLLLVAAELLTLAFAVWAVLAALFLSAFRPITALLLAALATSIWADRLFLALGGLL